jgi:GWxTD domain-containing protein
MHAASASLCMAVLLAGCGGSPGGVERPRPAGAAAPARPLEVYRDLGFMTGTGQFPAVASFSSMAGPGDSTYVIIGMSIPNSALRFLREAGGFRAEYGVDMLFLDADSMVVKRTAARETVRIASFAETTRSDESVIFQHIVALVPGRYTVRVNASDANSARGFGMSDTLAVPAYGAAAARLSAPMLVHEAAGRDDRATAPSLILNPRHTIAYGGDAARLYVESYGGGGAVSVAVTNEQGDELWATRAELAGDGAVHHGVVEIPAAALPLGRVWVELRGAGAPSTRTPLLLTVSDQWMVTNYEEVLQFLRYIAHAEELQALREGTAAERRAAWEAFWAARDPLPMTGVNEFREQFFQRIRYATEAFREAGRPGWNTHRGEVYIVLGPPDYAIERQVGRADLTGRPNAEEWVYGSVAGGRLSLLFHDRGGLGRLELVPSSASAFRSAAERLKPRRPSRGG